VALLCLVLIASAAAIEEDKPAKTKAPKTPKKKGKTKTIKPSYFMPRTRVVIVPKGDPRAYPRGVSPITPAVRSTPTPLAPTLKAGAPAPKKLQAGAPSACPVYGNAPTSAIKGNGNKSYSVVKIAPQHFSGSKGGDDSMTRPTACAFSRMAEAAAKSKIRLTINSGFRTLARQQYFWNCYVTKKCNNGNLAAHPGTSNHGTGIALDLNAGSTSSANYRWLAANASKFGFRRTVPTEPWHWEYRP